MAESYGSVMLSNREALADRLMERRLHGDAAWAKAELFRVATERLMTDPASDRLSAEPIAVWVPGRVEVLGKHTDYAGGSSITTATEYGFAAVARPRGDDRLRVTELHRDETVDLRLAAPPRPRLGHWSNYPTTVARRVVRNFPNVRCGADVVLVSDLPPAAGMSSSSALMIATLLVLSRVNDLPATAAYREALADEVDLAGYAASIEAGQGFGTLEAEGGVGTFGGSEDHTAILCSRAGELSQFAYCPTRLQRRILFPVGYTLVLASSGLVAEKTGAALELYNRQSRLVAALLGLWRESTGRPDPTLAQVVASGPDAVQRLRDMAAGAEHPQFSGEQLVTRLDHFITENVQIIPAAGDALEAMDMDQFGRLVDASQRAAEQLLGNQVPQTVYLAAQARELGAVAASSFGAGFGGSVWAMVPNDQAESFQRRLAEAYREQFPMLADQADVLVSRPGPAACIL